MSLSKCPLIDVVASISKLGQGLADTLEIAPDVEGRALEETSVGGGLDSSPEDGVGNLPDLTHEDANSSRSTANGMPHDGHNVATNNREQALFHHRCEKGAISHPKDGAKGITHRLAHNGSTASRRKAISGISHISGDLPDSMKHEAWRMKEDLGHGNKVMSHKEPKQPVTDGVVPGQMPKTEFGELAVEGNLKGIMNRVEIPVISGDQDDSRGNGLQESKAVSLDTIEATDGNHIAFMRDVDHGER